MRMESKRITHPSLLNARIGAVAALCCLFPVLQLEMLACQSNPPTSENRPPTKPAPWVPSLKTPAPANQASPIQQQPTPAGSEINSTQTRQENRPFHPDANSGTPVVQNSGGPNPDRPNDRLNATPSEAEAPATMTSNPQDIQRPNVPAQEGSGATKVTKRLDRLPNSAGQIWREYDITPYTSQITATEEPQQAILDWVLRETGTEMWFHQPLGILHANRQSLYVYHTPEIQGVVKGVVDRFVRTRGQIQRIELSLVTIGNPNWRAQSYTMLQPIEVRAPGVEAWMISKENAALLHGQLRQRADFKEHSSGTLTNHDGQTFKLAKTRPVQFVRSLRWVPNQVPNYQPMLTNIEEGYSLAISCLTAADSHAIEATIKCEVDQVEKLNNVRIDVPSVGGAQQMNLQIPQMVSWRLHERFRWPDDQVLLMSCGVVATPEPEKASMLRIPGLSSKSTRADALLFIEYRGPATEASLPRTANSDLTPIRPRQ